LGSEDCNGLRAGSVGFSISYDFPFFTKVCACVLIILHAQTGPVLLLGRLRFYGIDWLLHTTTLYEQLLSRPARATKSYQS
jgi:hypothetical protein